MSSLLGVIIEETDTFAKSIKKLQKRFKNVEADCEEFVQNIKFNIFIFLRKFFSIFLKLIKSKDIIIHLKNLLLIEV